MATLYTTTDSPIGELLLVGDGTALSALYMQAGRRKRIDPSWERSQAAFAAAIAQLGEYFAGERRDFDLPLAPRGADFQLRAWQALREIPYGETWSYGELARHIGRPTGSRAVGMANGRNPVSIVVPCHRVIGANGTLTGYAGGLERKQQLLELEQDALF